MRAPDGNDLHATIQVEDEGVATSGNYERYFVRDGVRYHHIIDPKNGQPARGVSSATVIAPNAGLADAYSTAVFVLGVDRGIALADSHLELEALIFDDIDLEPRATPGMQARLTRLDTGGLPRAAAPPVLGNQSQP